MKQSEVIEKTNQAVIHRLIYKGGQQVLMLVMGIILARLLSPAEFGVIAIANMVVQYANNFTNLGLNNALVQNDRAGSREINTVFTIDLAISITLMILTLVAADTIASFFHNQAVGPVLRWMSLYYVITTFYHIPVAVLRRKIEFRFLTIIEFIQSLLTSCLAIYLALVGFSYWSIVIASLALPMLVALVLIVKTRWIPSITIGRNMGEFYSFGLWNFIRAQVNLLVSKVDYFVIGRYLDVQSLGLYEKSFELTDRAVTGLTTPVNSIFFSTFSRIKGDPKQIKKVFLDAGGLLTLLSYPCLLGLVGVAPHFVISCLGQQWAGAVVPLQILATACLFKVLFGLVSSVNVAVGKYKLHTLLVIVTSLFFMVLCLSVVQYGIIAVCLAFLSYSVVGFFATYYLMFLNVKVGVVELFGVLWCPLSGSGIMLCVILMLRNFLMTDYGSILQFVALVVIGASLYGVWTFYFYRKGVLSFAIGTIK